MRSDVRTALLRAAEDERRWNGCCIALVSEEFVQVVPEWSEPVQVRVVEREGGLVELEFRRIAA